MSETPDAASNAAQAPRIAVLADFAAEEWPSMDLCADQLYAELLKRKDVNVELVRPEFRRRASDLPFVGKRKGAFNADRVFNRYYDYPRHLNATKRRCQFFHVADHSYAQLVLSLPAERTGVFCHDLDTFRCLLEPELDPRPGWYRRLIRSTLRGLTQAALVFHTTEVVRQQILHHALVPPERLVHAPLGVDPAFCPAPGAAGEAPPVSEDDAGSRPDADSPPDEDAPNAQTPASASADPEPLATRYLLHVGSCIPRKRVDLLLRVFNELRRTHPHLRLIKVGGPWAPEHEAYLRERDLDAHVELRARVPQAELIELYRGAALVLHPSDREGFGLPLIEALACGAIVVASAIPVHQEVGDHALVYCPPGKVEPWVSVCNDLLALPRSAPPLQERLEHAQRYTWSAHADAVARAYLRLEEDA